MSLIGITDEERRSAYARVAAATRARRLHAAKDSLADFIQNVVTDDHGVPLELAPMHVAWVRHIDYCWARGLRAIILAHFGSGKSSTLAVPVVAWLLGRDPNKRIKIVTNDDSNARRRTAGVGHIIESASYRSIFPGTRRGHKWTEHELYLKRTGMALDPSVQARGILTTGIGGRADALLFDDVVDQKNAMDTIQRRKVKQFIEDTWLTRLEPDGCVLYVATLWHLDDATHHLMQQKGWCSLVQRVSDDCDRIEQEVVGAGSDYPMGP